MLKECVLERSSSAKTSMSTKFSAQNSLLEKLSRLLVGEHEETGVCAGQPSPGINCHSN